PDEVGPERRRRLPLHLHHPEQQLPPGPDHRLALPHLGVTEPVARGTRRDRVRGLSPRAEPPPARLWITSDRATHPPPDGRSRVRGGTTGPRSRRLGVAGAAWPGLRGARPARARDEQR